MMEQGAAAGGFRGDQPQKVQPARTGRTGEIQGRRQPDGAGDRRVEQSGQVVLQRLLVGFDR